MGFIALKINHVQFNVFNKQDLLDAQKNPEKYRHLLVRVAGYTANYVDLSRTLQEEIIARTEYGV
jgi:formate C-acetyltransferase